MRLISLVELIVVLVILAILAAILVPALLGWIDEARNKQYVLQARNIIIAAQTVADEAYAAGETNPCAYVTSKTAHIKDVADVKAIGTLATNLSTSTTATAENHDDYTISQATVTFTVGDKDSTTNDVTKTMHLYNGAWTEGDAPTASDFKVSAG